MDIIEVFLKTLNDEEKENIFRDGINQTTIKATKWLPEEIRNHWRWFKLVFGDLGFWSSYQIFSICVFWTSSLYFMDSFINGSYFELIMDPLDFTSYKYVYVSLLLSQPLVLYN